MDLVFLYHSNCFDGFGAAWVAHTKYPDATFIPVKHGDPPPYEEIEGKDVVIMDFSYKRDVILKMSEHTHSLLILDHHKTAEEDLTGFVYPPLWATYCLDVDRTPTSESNDICALFDMNRSGIGIAWDYFTRGDERPFMVDYIEDRDLWKFKYGENTRLFHAGLSSYPMDFAVWDRIAENRSLMIEEGAAIERKHQIDVESIYKVSNRIMTIDGYEVPVCNAPMTVTSDLGNYMCRAELTPFAACYWDTAEHRVFSLRSVGEFDVSEIAKHFGGGGHKNAAGFQVPYDQVVKLGLL